MKEAKSSFWTFHSNYDNQIERIIKALLGYYVKHRNMSQECSDYIIYQCEENSYEKLIGHDLVNFVIVKWRQYEKL
jgi:hypothetical protein